MIEIKNLLPIGSVVLLEGGTKPLMVYGVRQTDNTTQTEYDYIGVVYPEGHMGGETQFLFNHKDIREVQFTGHETPERQQFLESLAEFYAASEK